jgi:hypothetical protein
MIAANCSPIPFAQGQSLRKLIDQGRFGGVAAGMKTMLQVRGAMQDAR